MKKSTRHGRIELHGFELNKELTYRVEEGANLDHGKVYLCLSIEGCKIGEREVSVDSLDKDIMEELFGKHVFDLYVGSTRVPIEMKLDEAIKLARTMESVTSKVCRLADKHGFIDI